jgi:hypothetical protein
MQKIEIVTLETQVTTDILCDMCGRSCKSQNQLYEFATFKATWGFSSKRDMLNWHADLCESCSERVKDFIEKNGGTVRETYGNSYTDRE